MKSLVKLHSSWLVPLLVFVIYAPWSGSLDLQVSNLFYNSEGVGDNRFVVTPFTRFLFEWGPLPAWIFVSCSLLFLMYSLWKGIWKEWRRAALALVMVLAIGSGLVVHVLLKDQWGRPRPRQIVEFNGEQNFRPFYLPDFSNPIPSKSFACGHCSVGFFFFSLALAGWYMQKRWMEWLGYFLALGLGGILSYSRISEGAHFLSDALASAWIMWTASLIICWCLFPRRTNICTV